MRVLVLGGNGFICRNLVSKLVSCRHNVISFDLTIPKIRLAGVEYVIGDFFNDIDLEKYTSNIELIVHGICTINPGNSNQKYMQGYAGDFVQTIKLCNIVFEKNLKMIFLSSGGTVYGTQEIMPIVESTATQPINHYGNLKVCIENTIMIFNQQNNTDIKIARISNPYGPGQDFEKGVGFIDAVLKKALYDETIELWGDGTIVRDYIYIDDVCTMILNLIAYNGKEKVFNLSTGKGTSQMEILNIARQWFPELMVIYKESRNVDVKTIVLDNSKIQEVIAMDTIDVEEGMFRYYSYLTLAKKEILYDIRRKQN